LIAIGESSDGMDMTASQKYLTDIGVNLEDVSCLIAFFIVQCTSIGEITRDGFIKGWRDHK
jgi:DCN1-like protein 1/2